MGVTATGKEGQCLLERALQERQELRRADRARQKRDGDRRRLQGAARHRPGMLQKVLSSGAGARFTSAAAAGTPNTTGLDSVRANAGRRSFSEPSPPIRSSRRAAGATTPSTPPGLRPSGSGFPVSPVPSLVSRPDRDRRAAILSPGARDRQLDCPLETAAIKRRSCGAGPGTSRGNRRRGRCARARADVILPIRPAAAWGDAATRSRAL